MRLWLAMLVLTFACASQKPAQVKLAQNDVPYSSPGQPKPKGILKCHTEADTGSNLREKVCEFVPDKEEPTDSTMDDAYIKMQQRAAQHEGPGSGQPYKPGP